MDCDINDSSRSNPTQLSCNIPPESFSSEIASFLLASTFSICKMVLLTSQSKVLIIGAGIAGLSLAQILRKQGISFEIFERDDGNHSQGWAVALDK